MSGRLTCNRPPPSLWKSMARSGRRPWAIDWASHFSKAAFSGARSGSARLVPLAVEILALEVESRPTAGHAVLVGHGQDPEAISTQPLLRLGIAGQQSLDESFDHPVGAAFPGMCPGAEEDVMRRLRIAHTHDLQRPPADRLADGRDLDQRIGPDRLQQAVEVGNAVRLQARDVQPRARHLDGQPHAVFGQLFQIHRPPISPRLPKSTPPSVPGLRSRACRSSSCRDS